MIVDDFKTIAEELQRLLAEEEERRQRLLNRDSDEADAAEENIDDLITGGMAWFKDVAEPRPSD